MKKQKKVAVLLAALVCLSLLVAVVAGCDGATSKTETSDTGDSAKTTTGTKGKVLIVIAVRDFSDTEYNAVSLALAGTGYETVVANASGADSTGDSQGVVPVDTTIEKLDADDYAAVVLIGGPGASQYFGDAKLQSVIKEMAAAGKPVAAICVAPVTLANAGVLNGKNATVFPSEVQQLKAAGAVVVEQPVVVDGNIVTGNGPEAADEFARAVKSALGK
ncbi:MAG: DJ-1/PfpI family protein [Actinobacteria bacterium]|nr:DJ-1/PfpI family protein [Actinomycetota bacterium]MBU1943673.1 DJ-1/PfpI family protein [Actinomycetota bacterium]MBU2686183.1 DJ-1/PfpI family protein [Actinomycetota bacterium]